MAPHQIPEYALSADHGFSLVLRLEGVLAKADFDSPSHPVAVATNDGAREISLSGGSALMDRDFVLVIKEPAESAVEGLWAADDKEYVALASFHPVFPGDVPKSPRCVTLVVDCSGSMGGDSIAQARTALREIISLLKPDDYFNLIAFGSTFHSLFPETMPASDANISIATRFVQQLDAHMGGTEIGAALNAAYQCGKITGLLADTLLADAGQGYRPITAYQCGKITGLPADAGQGYRPVTAHQGRKIGLPADILLITDGQVWNHEAIVKDAQQSGHRIFSVGVGSAVTEAFVRRIAETTSGACELVSPRENMAERIVQHFQRMDQPRAKSVQIEWPTRPIRQIPDKVENIYAGDTLHAFAWLSEPPPAKVRLAMTFEDGRTVTQDVSILKAGSDAGELPGDLPRVAVHARLATFCMKEAVKLLLRHGRPPEGLIPKEAIELAVRYQLVTSYTSCVLVYEREEQQKSAEVPALRKVPQVLAAGWGGGEHIRFQRSRPSAGGIDAGDSDGHGIRFSLNAMPESNVDPRTELEKTVRQPTADFERLIAALNVRYPDTDTARLDITTIDELVALGLDQEVADTLSDILSRADGKVSEQDIIITLLAILAGSACGKGFSRHVKRLIRAADKQTALPGSSVKQPLWERIFSSFK